jgi:hypothetical protein
MAWIFLGMAHIVCSAVLVLSGSTDYAVIWSQFVGGLVEIALALFFSLEV